MGLDFSGLSKNMASKTVGNGIAAQPTPLTQVGPRNITDKVMSMQARQGSQGAQGVNPPEQYTIPIAPAPQEVAQVVQAAPAQQPAAPKRRGRPSGVPKATVEATQAPVAAYAAAPQAPQVAPQASTSTGGFLLLQDVLFVKGSAQANSMTLIEVLQPTIDKILAESQVGHWTIAENAEALLAYEFDQYLTEAASGGHFPANFAIIVESTSKEYKAVRSVLDKHSSMILRGV